MPAQVCGEGPIGEAVASKLRTTSLQDTMVEADPCCTLCLVRPLKSSSGGEWSLQVSQAEKGTGPSG